MGGREEVGILTSKVFMSPLLLGSFCKLGSEESWLRLAQGASHQRERERERERAAYHRPTNFLKSSGKCLAGRVGGSWRGRQGVELELEPCWNHAGTTSLHWDYR